MLIVVCVQRLNGLVEIQTSSNWPREKRHDCGDGQNRQSPMNHCRGGLLKEVWRGGTALGDGIGVGRLHWAEFRHYAFIDLVGS